VPERCAETLLESVVRANLQPADPEFVRREKELSARLESCPTTDRYTRRRFTVPGVLASASRGWPEPDSAARLRLSGLDNDLAAVSAAFPEIEPDVVLCRQACGLLEAAWRERAEAEPSGGQRPCDCALCACLPAAPARTAADYRWRRSDGPPLVVKIWPYRHELDSVLTCGWVWTRALNDSDRDLGLRQRYDDDIVTFHEYKRVIAAVDTGKAARRVRDSLPSDADFGVNGARALMSGLFAAYKRRLDEHWLARHRTGEITLPASNPLDRPGYGLLQLLDCLFWHVPPSSELWREQQLASLLLSRVEDDMTDVRADAVTGEISNFWLSAMPAHEKTLYAACVIAHIKYGCTPEAHSLLWNTWLTPATIVWQALTGRHALWFDGIPTTTSVAERPADDCVLCGLSPNACTGLLAGTVTLTTGPRPTVATLCDRTARLAARCRHEAPHAWPLLRGELAAFEALHGPWHGNPDTTWEILSRTYIAALTAGNGATHARTTPLSIQANAAAIGAELFHTLNQMPTGKEDTALLAFMFGAAHPHFLWNCLGHSPAPVHGDWLDG
jgi:hypothetical protein